MSVTASRPAETRRRVRPFGATSDPWAAQERWAVGERAEFLFAAWVGFCLLCIAAMVRFPAFGAVAFHFVWISMAIVYGLQGWSQRMVWAVLGVVVVATTAAMASFVAAGGADWMELTEVPLMALVFLSMVWHVRRRASALAESREAAARERRAQELKELFVRNCSHEMRTPITVARGYAELVRKHTDAPGDGEDLDVVLDELDKLGSLAARMLRLAEAYESEQFEREPLDVGALVRRTVQRWRPTAEREWVVTADRAVVDADESRLEAALDAVVENALKFTRDGDRIALTCGVRDQWCVVEVRDAGLGFVAAAAEAAAGTGRRGTGLGLAIVRAVAEGHGGRLETGPAPARGAVVRMLLPLAS